MKGSICHQPLHRIIKRKKIAQDRLHGNTLHISVVKLPTVRPITHADGNWGGGWGFYRYLSVCLSVGYVINR